MDAPEAQYLDRDGALLAYQVLGNHPVNVLWVGEAAQHWDLAWTDPHMYELYERSASFARTAYMQTRGLGLSEPINYWPTLEQQGSDLLAVLDAAGMDRATLVGSLTTCGAVSYAAATAPERVHAVVLLKALPCGPAAPNAYEHGWTPRTAEEYCAGWRAVMRQWGSGASVGMWDSVLDTPYNRRLMALLERCSARPNFAEIYVNAALEIDNSPFLRAIQAPALVLHTPTGHEPEAVVRRAAELIPHGTFHVLEPTPPGASIGEAYLETVRLVREAATGVPYEPDAGRLLGTVVFTDLVSSTDLLARIGDAEYRDLRAAHERQVRLAVAEAGGRLINVIGDGTISMFDGPTRAVRAAADICRAAAAAGLQVRAGVHTGELERSGSDVTGLTVHIGARITALARAGEVLVSSTVRDLVAGSGLVFDDRGSYELKGVPGRWGLAALAIGGEPVRLPDEPLLRTPLDRAALRTARTAPGLVRTALRIGNALQRYRARRHTRDLAREPG